MRLEPKLIPTNLNGNLRRGGYTLMGRTEGDADVVSLGHNWQLRGRSGAGFLDAESRIFFDNHVIAEPDNLQISRYNTRTEIRAGTMDRLLSGEALQDIGFTDQVSPTNDHQITDLQLADIVDHIIRKHSNPIFDATLTPDGVITQIDIDTTNSVALERYNVGESANLWRSLQKIGGGEQKGEFYIPFFDRQNKFYYQPFPAFWTTKPTSKGTIDKNHLRNAIQVKRNANQPSAKLGQVNLTAYQDFDTVHTASFPTNPGDGKILPPRGGIFADSGAKATTFATRLYQWLTRKYTITIELDPGMILFGDDGKGIDLSNMITLDYNGPVEDAISGAGLHLDLSDDYFVFGVQINFDSAGKMAKGTLILESDPT